MYEVKRDKDIGQNPFKTKIQEKETLGKKTKKEWSEIGEGLYQEIIMPYVLKSDDDQQ